MSSTTGGLEDVGFWNRFWSRVTGRNVLEPGQNVTPGGENYTESGVVINQETALRISAVWACVGIRSDTVSSLPLYVKNDDKTNATDHPLYGLLRRSPNPDMSTSEFFGLMVAHQDLRGNAFAEIVRFGGKVISLMPLVGDVKVSRRINGTLFYTHRLGGREKEYEEDDILHFRGLSLDGLVGLSPIQYASETMGGLLAANSAANGDFKNGLRVGGIINSGQKTLTDPQRTDLRSNLSRFAAPEGAFKWLVLEAGMTVEGNSKLRINPVDAQLLESRYFGIEEICRAYRVPPQLIGHTDKASSWASSLTNLNQGFLTYSIRPLLVRMEQTMMRKLLPKEQRTELDIKFNFRGLLRGSFKDQMNGYVQGLNNGIYCVDEVRELEDYPPLPNGEGKVYRVSLNTGSVTDNQGNPDEKT